MQGSHTPWEWLCRWAVGYLMWASVPPVINGSRVRLTKLSQKPLLLSKGKMTLKHQAKVWNPPDACLKLLADKNDGEPCCSPPSSLCPSCLDLGEAGCCQANRSIWPQEKQVPLPDAYRCAWECGRCPSGTSCAVSLQHRDTVKETYRKDGEGLLISNGTDRTSDNSFKLKEVWFRLGRNSLLWV